MRCGAGRPLSVHTIHTKTVPTAQEYLGRALRRWAHPPFTLIHYSHYCPHCTGGS